MNNVGDRYPGVHIRKGATVGVPYTEGSNLPEIGPGGIIRGGTIIYDDVVIGRDFSTGHHALIREQTVIGDGVLVGTQVVIDGECNIGDKVSLQTGAYVPSKSTIGNRVFLGPNATLLNDPYPVRKEVELDGPTLNDDVTIGANATVLPSVNIGEGAFVAAGAVVTEDIPSDSLAIGVPAEIQSLPDPLEGANRT